MILLDNNISPKLCRPLQAVFPGALHVEHVGLDNAPDSDVWNYASANRLTILTKDSDFNQRSKLYGHPPKVIWLRCGNVPSSFILSLLMSNETDIRQFLHNPAVGLLEIY